MTSFSDSVQSSHSQREEVEVTKLVKDQYKWYGRICFGHSLYIYTPTTLQLSQQIVVQTSKNIKLGKYVVYTF